MAAEALQIHANTDFEINGHHGPFIIPGRGGEESYPESSFKVPYEVKQGETVYLNNGTVTGRWAGDEATAKIDSGGNQNRLWGHLLTTMLYEGKSVTAQWGPVILGETPRSVLLYDVRHNGETVFTVEMKGHNRRDVILQHLGERSEPIDFPGVKDAVLISASDPFEAQFVGLSENDRAIWERFYTVRDTPSPFRGKGFFYLMAEKTTNPLVWVHLGLAVHTVDDDRVRLYEAKPQRLLDFTREKAQQLNVQLHELGRISAALQIISLSDGEYWNKRGGFPAQLVDVLSRYYHHALTRGDYKQEYLAGVKRLRDITGFDLQDLLKKLDRIVVKAEAQRLRKAFDDIQESPV